MYCTTDTIAAVASPPGAAPRGILRISGPDVVSCLDRCFRCAGPTGLRRIRRPTVVRGLLQASDPVGEVDTELYLWPTHRSYTRQPMAECHTWGSPPVLDAALRALCDAGARLAEPGEFTLRAFLAGRVDLTQAEAVLGVIDARNRGELDIALRQLAGGLASPLKQLHNDLLDVLAHLEAGLDFVDEDIEFISQEHLTSQLEDAQHRLASIRLQMSQRDVRDDRPRVVLLGWPNVGKSSLFNALCRESAAIVAAGSGTTRDFLARDVVFDGVAFTLIDTAGTTPDTHDQPLAAAARQARDAQAAQADIQLLQRAP
jgi:tRNA modification GTPase